MELYYNVLLQKKQRKNIPCHFYKLHSNKKNDTFHLTDGQTLTVKCIWLIEGDLACLNILNLCQNLINSMIDRTIRDKVIYRQLGICILSLASKYSI